MNRDGDDAPDVDDVNSVNRDDDRDWRDEYLDEQLEEHGSASEAIGPGRAPMSRFRHGSLGVTLGAAMTGLGNVLEPRKQEETAVIVDHDEPDHSRDPVELRLDQENPADSVIIIRKWVEDHPDRRPRGE